MTQKTERIRKNILKLGFLEKFIEFQKFIDLRARPPAVMVGFSDLSVPSIIGY